MQETFGLISTPRVIFSHTPPPPPTPTQHYTLLIKTNLHVNNDYYNEPIVHIYILDMECKSDLYIIGS